jgi:hypothetical protein
MTLIVKENQMARSPRVCAPLAVDLGDTLIHADLFVESTL